MTSKQLNLSMSEEEDLLFLSHHRHVYVFEGFYRLA